jgi:hypothetical protein
MKERRRVHVEARVAEACTAYERPDPGAAPVSEICPQYALEVANTHVVRRHREVPATEVGMRDLQVAGKARGQRHRTRHAPRLAHRQTPRPGADRRAGGAGDGRRAGGAEARAGALLVWL